MDVVPAEVLADTVDRRHVDRDLCALQLDGYLRRLARQEAVCRRVLGRLARTFLAGRYHHRLGFARLGDYTRERLSPRSTRQNRPGIDGSKPATGVGGVGTELVPTACAPSGARSGGPRARRGEKAAWCGA